jgi:hypothetical protein
MIVWRAFLASGSEVTSEDMPWSELPHGVIVAVWWDDNGQRHLECGADSLVHTGHAIVSVNLPTIEFQEAAAVEASLGVLKFGKYLPPELWAAIRERADNARIPPKV